jgi:microcystin-dependent protein
VSFTPGQVLTAADMNNLLASIMPTGGIVPFAVSSAPTGWLLCDGAAVSRTTYATLFSAIGTTYGVGNGTTTFNIPNLKGRVPVGLDSADTQFDALGETGGAKTHTLTTAEMPVHTHTQNSHNHTQNSHNHTQDAHNHRMSNNATLYRIEVGGGSSILLSGSGEAIDTQNKTAINQAATATNQSATATNQNTGSGNAHNNLQPYIALNFIIKT